MIKQYFAQAWAQLRQQPVMSAVSIAGTALAIFLIMLVVGKGGSFCARKQSRPLSAR